MGTNCIKSQVRKTGMKLLQIWNSSLSSRSKYNGVHKVPKCLGSWMCPNKSCTFWVTSHDHQPNRINWKGVRGWKDIKICQICATVGLREGCGARKLVESNPTTCQGKIDKKKKKDQIRKKIQLKGFQGTRKDLAVNNIANILTYGTKKHMKRQGLWKIIQLTNKWGKKGDETSYHDQNSFDAVAIIKKNDTHDPFCIYWINNGAINNSSDYIFKSSWEMIKLATGMDGPEIPLQLKNAYFKATHQCTHGSKSLGLWIYHPTMRKICNCPAWR